MGPGILATVLASATTELLIFRAQGSSAGGTALVGFSLSIFFAMGVGMSIVAEMYRRARRKAAEYDRRLLQAENDARLSAVFHSSLLGMSIIGLTDSGAVTSTPHSSGMFGYTREEVLGRTRLQMNLWSDPRDRNSAWQALQKGESLRQFETQCRTKSGETWAALISAEVIEVSGEKCVWATFQE